MPNNQIFKVLAVIDKKEMTAFGNYLKGMHPNEKQLGAIQKHLESTHPKYNVAKMTEMRVGKKFFNELFLKIKETKEKTEKKELEEKLKKKISNAYGRLKNILLEFLAVKELQEHSFVQDYLLIRSYERRKANNLFIKQIKAAHVSLEDKLLFGDKTLNKSKNNGLNLFYFLKKQLLHHLRYFLSSDATFLLQKSNREVQYSQFYIEKYNKLARLKYQTELLNRDKLLKLELNKLEESSEEFDFLKKLADLNFELLSNQKDSDYKNLYFYLKKNFKKFHKHETTTALFYLFNYSMQAIKKGKLEYRSELLQLYLFSLNNELLLLETDISANQFLNIINLASIHKKFDWANELINRYAIVCEKLDIIKLAKSEILFEKEGFKEIILLLKDISFYENIHFELRIKTISLMCYYMLEYPNDFIKSYMKAFSELLRRSKKINVELKESYNNFLKIYRQIHFGKTPLNHLKKIIETEKNLQCRKWLLNITNLKLRKRND